MLTLAMILANGEHVQVTVQQAEFVVTCPYCKQPFKTINPDRIYCKQSHKVRAYERRVRVVTLT